MLILKKGITKPKQQKMSAFTTTDKLSVTMTTGRFKDGIVQYMVQHCVPFSFFQSTALKALNGEMRN